MYISADLKIEKEVKVIEELGICSTCNYLDNCARRKKHTEAVWYCEEFDNNIEPKISTKIRLATEQPEIPIEEKIFVGLCANCEIRNECAYPKPEGGVWHCNEYV
ncbi:MAG: hypothetical protein QG635_268 [Bacteroidota bacterium]|nr:hypothetical protein [Bacteroidota bacterium]